MSFAWYDSYKSTDLAATFEEKALQMQRLEVRERAGLLRRLGRTKDEAIARCKQNLEWDYQLHGKPRIVDEIKTLVSDVYAR